MILIVNGRLFCLAILSVLQYFSFMYIRISSLVQLVNNKNRVIYKLYIEEFCLHALTDNVP